MNKPTLTKEQAEAIEQCLFNGDRELVISGTVDRREWQFEYKALSELRLDDICRAFYIGYTVERTPEEKVREMVEVLKMKNNFVAVGAVAEALNAYGHVIEGVNDK